MEDFPLILILLPATVFAAVAVYSYVEKRRRAGTAAGKERSGAPPAQRPVASAAEVKPAAAPAGDIFAAPKTHLAEGRFVDCIKELEKVPKPRWGEAGCALALRASLRLVNYAYARKVFEWSVKQPGLANSSLLQYLFAINCERAGDAKAAAAGYDKLLRLKGSYQDCELRLRRLRRLPAEDARAMSVQLETTGRRNAGVFSSSAPAALPELGEVAGRFSVLGLLGVGGNGAVFLAKEKASGRLVALKRMSRDLARGPDNRALFLEEAKTLSGLRHPHIVGFYEAVESDEDLYLVLEYVDWETLQTVLAFRGKLTPGEVTPVLAAVAEALACAHGRKVIHRDLKPGNIAAGPKGLVKVMDFGIARHFDPDAEEGQEVDVVGTPPYMAPEQHAGVTTTLSDIYSFGVTAYVLLSGRLPFAGPAPLYYSQKLERDYPRLPSAVPAGLRELIDSCLMFDPAKRPPDAAALLRALSGI